MLVAIGLYLLFMMGVGIAFSKKNETVDEFYLGGRKLGPFVTAMSAEASDMSSWLLMGLPGVAYLSGVGGAGWTALGLAVGTYLNWLWVAKKIRHYSHAVDAITVPQFFSKRFGDDRSILAAVAGLIIVVFFIPYIASGFAACGKLFGTIFGLDYLTAMIVSAIVIVSYTVVGGFLAASMTDLIQSIVMTLALIVILGFGVNAAGGFGAVMENARSLTDFLSFNSVYDPKTGASNPYSFLDIVSTLAWGLGYFGMPHILIRFMAIENAKSLVTSRRFATFWVFVSMGIAIWIGVIGNAMSANGAMAELKDAETIVIHIGQMISEINPALAMVAGMILAGILAATMSTADSQLLVASSSVSENLASEFLRLNLSGKRAMLVARVTMILITAIAIYLARDPDSSVFGIVSFAWAGFGGAFGPVMLLALFWRRGNKWGALAGMISGGAMIFIWKYLIAPLGGAFAIYELLPAFVTGGLVMIIVSLLTPAPAKEIVELYDQQKHHCKHN